MDENQTQEIPDPVPSGVAAAGSTQLLTTEATNPYYYAPPAYPSSYEPEKDEGKALPNAIGLGALGAMLFIAAIGLWVMLANVEHRPSTAGRTVLISVGLIVLLAGVILAYAAWKGLRPGWFLWLTVVGAALAGPIVLGGVGLLAAGEWEETEYGYSSGYEVDYGYDYDYEEYWDLVELRSEELLEQDRDFSVTWLNPGDSDIVAKDETVVLDLTTEPKGLDLAFGADLTDATLQVLLTVEQVPLVDSLKTVGEGDVRVLFLDGSGDPDAWGAWVDNGFDPRLYPGWVSVGAAANQFTFDLDLKDSTVEFLVVDDYMALRAAPGDTDNRSAATGSLSNPQSSNGAGDLEDKTKGDDK